MLALECIVTLHFLVQLPVGCLGAVHIPWAFSQGWGNSHNNLTSTLLSISEEQQQKLRQNEVSLALLKVSSPLRRCSLAQLQGRAGREFRRLILPSIFGKCVSSQSTRENNRVCPSMLSDESMRWNKGTWADSFFSTLFVESLVLSKLTLPSFLMLS